MFDYVELGDSFSRFVLSFLTTAQSQALELSSGCRATLEWHQPLIELGEHPSQLWLVVALDLFSKVGKHACKFVQSPARQTGWQDHPGLLVLQAVGICDPSQVLPPVCPVHIFTGRKTIHPAVLSRIQIRLVACPARSLLQLPLQQSAACLVLPCRIKPESSIGNTHFATAIQNLAHPGAHMQN